MPPSPTHDVTPFAFDGEWPEVIAELSGLSNGLSSGPRPYSYPYDGYDVWGVVANGSSSARREVAVNIDTSGGVDYSALIQMGDEDEDEDGSGNVNGSSGSGNGNANANGTSTLWKLISGSGKVRYDGWWVPCTCTY